MDFPSFGDASGYSQLATACASALTSSGGDVFNHCYSPLRPIGIILYYSIPLVVTQDPVNVVYVTLTFNLLLFMGAFLALRGFLLSGPLPGLRVGRITPVFFSSMTFFPVLFNLVGHLPVTLSDLPAMAFFFFAIRESGKILFQRTSVDQIGRRYFLTGFWVALSSLLKQNYLVFGFFLIFSILWLDDFHSLGFRKKIYHLCLFGLGVSPILIQFINVYLHSGKFWLYDPDFLRDFAHVDKRPNIEAIAFNFPAQGAFMIKVTNDVNFLSFMVLKLFRGLFRFEWAIYIGKAAHIEQLWTVSRWGFMGIYALMASYTAFTLLNILRAPVSLRLLNLNALLISLFTGAIGHTELRYYIFPRVVLWISILYWICHGINHAGSSCLRKTKRINPKTREGAPCR